MKKLLIVDDHAIVRHGLMRVLQEILEQPFIFDEAADGQQAIRMGSSVEYDLILLDISLPDQSGLSVLTLLHQHNPKQPIIILSTFPEEQYAVRAIRAGASAYVNKGSAASVLKEAIDKVLAGKRYISPTQSELFAEAIYENKDTKMRHDALSDREHQLACLVTAGYKMTEIATKLNLSVKTVSTYRARVLEKLQLRTTADIINYCLSNNLNL